MKEEFRRLIPESQKDMKQERSPEKIISQEELQKSAEIYTQKIKEIGESIITEGTSLAKTSEEQKITESSQQEVEKVIQHAEKAIDSSAKQENDHQQALPESLAHIDIHNPAHIAKWFEEHADMLLEEHRGFIEKFGIGETMDKLFDVLKKAHGVESEYYEGATAHEIIRRKDEYGDGTIEGGVELELRDIAEWSTDIDGWGIDMRWDSEELEKAMKKFLERIQYWKNNPR